MQNKIAYIRRSCLTGKVVFLHYGASANACRVAYCCARKKVKEWVKQRPRYAAELKRNILRIANEFLANADPTQPLTPEQQEALKKLKRLSEEPIGNYRDFYEHVIEEDRRRAEDAKIRREMRERKAKENAKEKK